MLLRSAAALSFFFILSCAHKESSVSTSTRDTASVSYKDDLERSFQLLFEGPKDVASKELNDLMASALRNYLRGQLDLQRFDRRLDQAVRESKKSQIDIMADPTYVRMVARWIVTQRLHEKIIYTYESLIRKQLGKGVSKEDRLRAQQLRLQMMRILNDKQDYYQLIALAPLVREFANARLEIIAELKEQDNLEASEAPRMKGDISESIIKKVEKYPQEAPRFVGITYKAANSLTANEADELQMREAQEVAERYLRDRMTNQVSQGLPIRPSPEREGSISGSTFPEGTWALTYDDGPSHILSMTLFDELSKRGLKATFFWLQQNVNADPNMLELLNRVGMKVGSHSYSHPNMLRVDQRTRKHEIYDAVDDLNKLWQSQSKQTVKFYRLPYGAGMNDGEIRRMIASKNLVNVFWNVDSLDWQDRNPATIIERIKKQMAVQKRGIILMHDVHASSVAAAPLLYDHLKKVGAKVQLLEDIAKDMDGDQIW